MIMKGFPLKLGVESSIEVFQYECLFCFVSSRDPLFSSSIALIGRAVIRNMSFGESLPCVFARAERSFLFQNTSRGISRTVSIGHP